MTTRRRVALNLVALAGAVLVAVWACPAPCTPDGNTTAASCE